jgi:hypothetical protein
MSRSREFCSHRHSCICSTDRKRMLSLSHDFLVSVRKAVSKMNVWKRLTLLHFSRLTYSYSLPSLYDLSLLYGNFKKERFSEGRRDGSWERHQTEYSLSQYHFCKESMNEWKASYIIWCLKRKSSAWKLIPFFPIVPFDFFVHSHTSFAERLRREVLSLFPMLDSSR